MTKELKANVRLVAIVALLIAISSLTFASGNGKDVADVVNGPVDLMTAKFAGIPVLMLSVTAVITAFICGYAFEAGRRTYRDHTDN